jgi:RNA exonuclease 1
MFSHQLPSFFIEENLQCLTEDGKSLARICLIHYVSGKVVYDQFVKPEKPITDYLTRWSGITEESMTTATTTFTQVREKLTGILSEKPTPVLVGHSLESDLQVLKMSHPRCIDTAVIYHHPRGRPLKPGLAWLTKKWCHREIQNHGEGGHDPEEDARACLELLKKKVENGPGYGEFKTDQESIFERIARSTRSGGVKTAVVDHGTPANWHGAKATAAVACKTDEDVVKGVLEMIPNNHFIFGRFLELSDACGCAPQSVDLFTIKRYLHTIQG